MPESISKSRRRFSGQRRSQISSQRVAGQIMRCIPKSAEILKAIIKTSNEGKIAFLDWLGCFIGINLQMLVNHGWESQVEIVLN